LSSEFVLSSLPPPISPNDRPQLWKIGEYPFQDLTVALMGREPGLSLPRLYGERGQAQYGGDVLALCDDRGKLLAQCRCYEHLIPSNITSACTGFLNNFKHWKREEVRRFVLVVACDATSPTVITEIGVQTKRLKRKGVLFEVWDRAIVVQKIRPYPDLVNQYLGSDQTWVSLLCGPKAAGRGPISSTTSDGERKALEALLGEYAAKDAEGLVKALRMGRRGEVRAKLTAFRKDERRWAILAGPAKAAFLRLQAALEIDMSGDIHAAESLVREATELDPLTSVIRLQSRIRLILHGPSEALQALPDREDLETLCARGSLLLLLGQIESALSSLEAALRLDEEDADTLRLLAVTHTIRGDVPRARALLARLVQVEPEWEVVKQTRAVLYYIWALSSPAMQSPTSALPDPVEWSFVRQDDASLAGLDEAASIFGDLASVEERPQRERGMLEIWRLAALANHPGRQEEAAEYCASIINKHPCNIYALPWALARSYQVNTERISEILSQETASTTPDAGSILMLVGTKLSAQDFAGAGEVLEKYRGVFQEQGQGALWSHWWAMARVGSGYAKEALDFVRSSPYCADLQHAEVIALRAESQRSGDSGPLIERLRELCQDTHAPRFLLELCAEYAISGNWTALAERSAELLVRVPTPEAVRASLAADFETRNYERYLARTVQYSHLFTGSRLPLDIRRGRVGCLERLGRPREAFLEAEELLRDDASADALVSFTRLCAGLGQTRQAITAAEQLSTLRDLKAEDAVEVAELVAMHDAELSRRLLRAAQSGEIPARRVSSAVSLGYRLEIEGEMGELRKRLAELVSEESGLVEQVSREEVANRLEQVRGAAAETWRLYELGQIPVHLLVDRFRLNLAGMFLRDGGAISSPLVVPHVFIRYGARVTPGHPDLSTATRLNLDITTILLIHRFQLWEALVKAFAGTRIPRNAIPLLEEMLRWSAEAQPSWQRAQRHVAELAREGLVTSDISGADCHVQSNAEAGESPHINLRSVADELRSRGKLTEVEYELALAGLGAAGTEPVTGHLPATGHVHCAGSSPIGLALAGLLRPLAELFTVVVEPQLLAWLESSAIADHEHKGISEWVKSLIEELGKRLQGESLYQIPESVSATPTEGLAFACLGDLVQFPATPEDVLCIDDRFLNASTTRQGGVSIVGFCDVLKVLVDQRLISQGRAWGIAHELRAAGFWFIPVRAAEITHHVCATGIREGAVVETPELRVLRQYLAACAARTDLLRRGNPALQGDLGEIAFLTASRHAAAEAIARVWGSQQQTAAARNARCRWIIDALYIDLPGIRRLIGLQSPPEEERRFLGMDAAWLLLFNLIHIPAKGTGRLEGRRSYGDWIWANVFRRRCDANPELLDDIAQELKRRLGQMASAYNPPSRAEVFVWALQALPEPIRGRLQGVITSDPDVAQHALRTMNVAEMQFEISTFTTAVAKALRGGSAAAEALRPHEPVVIRRVAPNVFEAIDIERPHARRTHRLRNVFWGLLLPTRAEREESLRKYRKLFDIDDEAFEVLLSDVLATENDAERMERTFRAAQSSAPAFYETLNGQVRHREPLTEPDLVPPEAEALRRYHGLSGTDLGVVPFRDALDRAVTGLVPRVGYLEAALRLTAFPVAIPAAFETWFGGETAAGQAGAVHALLRASPSPIRRLHVLRLLSSAEPGEPALVRLRAWLIRGLMRPDAGAETGALRSVLRWAKNAFGRWPQARDWPNSLRLALAWAHADQVLGIYRRNGAEPRSLADGFEQHIGLDPWAYLEEDFSRGRDVADPVVLDDAAVIVNGLAYALNPSKLPLPEPEGSQLVGRVFRGQPPVPHPSLWYVPGVCPDSLGSFLGRDRLRDLNALIGPALSDGYDRAWRENLVQGALARILDEGTEVMSLLTIASVFRECTPPDYAGAAIAGRFATVDMIRLVERDRAAMIEKFMPLVMARISQLRDTTVRQHVESELIRLAGWYGSHSGTETEARGLVYLALAHSYPAPVTRPSISDLEHICLAIAAQFTKFAAASRVVVEQLCSDLPVDRSAGFWPLLVRLRAIDNG
jgi:tetratricopeptide (TPR) repeat protein